MKIHELISIVVCFSALTWSTQCDDPPLEGCTIGLEGCTCTKLGTCDVGLDCENNTCVDLSAASDADTQTGADTDQGTDKQLEFAMEWIHANNNH